MLVDKSYKTNVILRALLISVSSAIIIFSFFQLPVSAASASDVIINELMYNPISDDDNDEFLELYNRTASPIDISDWCFTDGITLATANPTSPTCFVSGTTIAANGYLVISPSPAQTNTTYGVSAVASYAGSKLSNGGETVTLVDDSANIINSATYDDKAPWPVSPDGTGPSLEIIDPVSDNNLPQSWGASQAIGGTPGAVNSLTNADPPEISGVSSPVDVQAATSTIISANISNLTSANLIYKINFDADISLSMVDDGTGDDQVSGDGVYTATIPGQSPGTLVRFKVSADKGATTRTSPGNDETINYHGYVVKQDIESGAPVINWFISDSDYADLIDDPSGSDETYFDCVIVVGNQVFDASKIRLKGEYTRTFEKQSFKVKLPKGHGLALDGVTQTPINEFHLNSDMPSNNYVTSLLAWRVFEQAGFPVPARTKAYIQRNGQFEGAYTLIEKYDKGWQADNPRYDSTELYEDYFEKEQPDDGDLTAITDWRAELESLSGDAKTDYVKSTVNIPNVINYMAAEAVSRNADWSVESNTISVRDSSSTERWSFLPWDFDLSFRGLPYYESLPNLPQPPGEGDIIDPHDSLPTISPSSRFVFTAIWDDAELQEMYKRRVRTLVDEIYISGKIQQWLANEFNHSREAIELDDQIWHDREEDRLIEFYELILPSYAGVDTNDPVEFQAFIDQASPPDLPIQTFNVDTVYKLPSPEEKMVILDYGLNKMKNLYAGDYTQRGVIPATQPKASKILINEFNYNPDTSQDHEYVELYNPNDYAVDLSDWSFASGVNMTLGGGSVIPSKGYAVVAKNDVAFRSQYGGNKVVLGEYSGNLSNEGETLTLLRKDGSLASRVTYAADGKWSPLANGNGYSQALIQSEADEALSACWAPSLNGGTPGVVNTNFDQTWLNSHQNDCRNRASVTTANGSPLADTGANVSSLVLFSILSLSSSVIFLWNYSGFYDIIKHKHQREKQRGAIRT